MEMTSPKSSLQTSKPPCMDRVSDDFKALTKVNGIRSVYLELTDDCLLQCLYCTPFKRKDTKTIDEGGRLRFQDFIKEISEAGKVDEVVLGGFGEITMVPGWDDIARTVDGLGISLNCISSLSKRLTDNEWDAFSRFRHMVISVDTVDIEHFKHVRRGGDIRAIIYNMMRIREKAWSRNVQGPHFQWASVIYHEMLPELAATIRTGIAAGVKSFEWNNLFHRDDSPHAVRSIAEVSDEEFMKDYEYIQEAKELIHKLGCSYIVSGGVQDVINERLEKIAKKLQKVESETPEAAADTNIESVHVGFMNKFVRDIPEGYTKNCLQPFTQIHLKVGGQAIPCCEPFVATGSWKKDNGADLVNNDAVRKVREGLLTGKMHPICRTCRVVGMIKVEEFQERIRRLLSA